MPSIVVGGGNGEKGGSGNLVEAMLAMLLAHKTQARRDAP